MADSGQPSLLSAKWNVERLIGDVTVKLNGAVVRKQQGFTEDKSILRSIVRDADQNLGVYGENVSTGAMQADDGIYLM